MRRRRFRLALLASLLLLASIAPSPAGDELLGRWLLVEQTYEEGERDLLQTEAPPVLRFERSTSGVRGTLTWEGRSSAWPAYPIPDGFATIENVEVRRGDDGRSITARYRVRPAEGDDTWLRVVESYDVTADGRLGGVMRIEFVRGGETRGGFTWHRSFEKGE
jgi:hypothetical protein